VMAITFSTRAKIALRRVRSSTKAVLCSCMQSD
jgi:hypothetical protein